MRPGTPLDEILEKDWDRQLFETKKGLATMTGWTPYHVFRSPRSPAGFPDRVLIRERIIYAELKREKTKPSAEQIVWLNGLARAGGEVYLWKPRDLDEIGEILGRRWSFISASTSKLADHPNSYLVHPDRAAWTPKSLWIPGAGRADGVE